MAFHVACPLTCQRICFCALGFPEKLRREKERKDYLEEMSRVEEFLKNPWSTGARGRSTVQIPAPRIVVPAAVDGIGGGDGSAVGGDGDEIRSAQTKRAALQRRAVAASIEAEDYVRKYEAGNFVDASGAAVQDLAVEDQGSSTLKVMCRICFSGENEGSKRAIRMLPCRLCNKKYHRNCLKSWAAFRDLFHWSSWVCPSCRICEVCRRAGDPNKFMFCKHCDDAYHCYCQQPPHKNITAGPFLCPKHTRCHSCGSTVPGSGFSTRWFLGYTCCDACGRLFVKGKYCPVCLKVYRDSESTPMVCCDVCERWVHCQCDGISDEKYLQFQADRNLHYKCAACRGDCYQVSDLDDAVQELWKRRDEADCDQIASLRAAAGLPFQEEIFSICPYSDDEENDAVTVKSDYGRPFRFFVKGLAEKSTKNTKEYEKKPGKTGKKHVKKKGSHVTLIGDTESPPQSSERHDIQLLENNLGDKMSDDMKTYRTKGPETQPFIKGRAPKVVKISSSKLQGLELRGADVKHASKTEAVKGTKLVIHLPARNRLATNSPKSEISTSPREQDLSVSSGNEDTNQQKANDKEKHKLEAHDVTPRLDDGKGAEIDSLKQLKGLKHKGKQSSLIKLGKFKKAEVPELNPKINRGSEEVTTGAVKSMLVLSGQKRNEGVATVMEPVGEATLKNEEILPKKFLKSTPINLPGENHNTTTSPSSGLVLKDPKPLLKLKFKNHYFESQSSWAAKGEEEKNSVKGQRSKRKRPSPLAEKALFREDENHGNLLRDNPIDEDIDANWILKKLGKDAIGKRVEVHQSSDDTWHKGMVIDMIKGTSSLSVRFDDGRSKTLELGKQGVRFIPQKQKRTKT